MRWDTHPYEPYDIQIRLMDALLDTLTGDYKVGLFESPTGTGKTLSIICSSLTWLREGKKQNIQDSDSDPDWVNEAYTKIINRNSNDKNNYNLYLDKLLNHYNDNILFDIPVKRMKFEKSYLPCESEIDFGEGDFGSGNSGSFSSSSFSSFSSSFSSSPIIFSSRTHSQLSQFALQLNLVKKFNRVKFLPLGGRNQLCINDKIKKLPESLINDACIDLQKNTGCEFRMKDNWNGDSGSGSVGGSGSGSGSVGSAGSVRSAGSVFSGTGSINPFSDPMASTTASGKFIDLSQTKIHDIEDLALLGRNTGICPYYAIRSGLKVPEIISLPYQLLLQESTRNILQLDISNSVIIIDEAHNLIDTITNIHSVSITLTDLQLVIKSLKMYLLKFVKRLSSFSRVNLSKLIKICLVIEKFINSASPSIGNYIPIEEILSYQNADLHNINQLNEYLNKSKIAFKIESYMEKLREEELETESKNGRSLTAGQGKKHTPLLFKVVKFLECLSNPSNEGRFFWSDKTTINYMLLDPSTIFQQIVSKAKCVLLCGGTMEPMEEFFDMLLPDIPKEQINTFKCGHIIPKDNLNVYPIKNWKNTTFEFLYGNRDNKIMIESLAEFILESTINIPAGMVIFFPSYSYLNKVLDIWKSGGYFNKINQIKKIFEEPTESNRVESLLSEYSQTVKNGAILLSVVGGKMSEGINFSDDMARAVFMVGLPYPNAFSGEIIAKKKFIETKVIEKNGSKTEAAQKSQNFYENLCMRAVNQSVGRSIRHINDYSIIYLIDLRYNQHKIQNKLSGWVKERIINTNNEEIFKQTKRFFELKCK